MLVSTVKSGPERLEAAPFSRQAVNDAVQAASDFLLRQQQAEGSWCGELEADTTLESDSIKMWHLLDRVDPAREKRLAATILKNQLADGGWPIYRDGPAELNATVKAAVALCLSGFPADDPRLQKAAMTVRRLGGLERINSFEKTYLALFGLYPWSQVPAIPPEILLLPAWFPFNIYEVAYWSRTILVPLAVLYSKRPVWKKVSFDLDALWVRPDRKRAEMTNFQKGGLGWRFFFTAADRFLKWHESWPWKPFRQAALNRADRWMNERMIETDGLGAIFPAMINAVFALKALGYSDGDPLLERAIHELERLELEDGEGLKVQPCFSPVWDTALALYVLGKLNRPEQAPALQRAGRWLKGCEIRSWGDWQVKNRAGRPGGWAFEYRNPFYPDVDDTAQVLLGFQAFYGKAASFSLGSFGRGLDWILTMQNQDGGWSSFDKDNHCRPLNHFPFADHNAMLDPSASDITGRILEMLSTAGFDRGHPSVKRAVEFLHRSQESDGTWFGRWGVNYIYGTWLAVRGLKAVGEPMVNIRTQQAARWLLNHQNPDGGWGETCRSYDDPSLKGKGVSTPSQTAWALMALMALEKTAEPAFERGIHCLLTTQQADGNWNEEPFTGTGFPRVFYLRYHLYRTYFPLLALMEAGKFIKE